MAITLLSSCLPFLATMTVAPVQTQEHHRIEGVVVDAEYEDPVLGAEVFAQGEAQGAITDSQGRFSLSVDQLPVQLIVQSALTEPKKINLTTKDIQEGQVLLRVSYLEDHTVEVVAERVVPLTASTRTVNAQEFRAVPRRTAEDALRLVPGFTLSQHGSEGKGQQFYLRGFDAIHGSELELSVEGVTMNEWSNIHAQGYLDVGFVIPETVESVEVVKGPFTLGQGAFALAGSANYQLGIAPQDRGVRAGYTFGTTFRHRGVVTYSPKQGDGEDFVAAELMRDQGFGQNRRVSRASLLGQWRLFHSPRLGSLSLLGSLYSARFQLPSTLREPDLQSGRLGFFDAYDTAPDGLSQRALLSLKHRYQRGSHRLDTQVYGLGRRLHLLENFTGFLLDQVHGDRREEHQDALSASFSTKYRYRVSESLTLQAGLGWRTEWIDQWQDDVGTQLERVTRQRDLKANQSIGHAYAGARYRYENRLWLSGGVRADLVHLRIQDRRAPSPAQQENQGERATFSPRLSAEIRLSESLRLFAAYGRGFRPPEARSFSSFVPGKQGVQDDVFHGRPENVTDDGVELGLRWMHNRYLALTAAGFGTFLRREIVFDHVSGVSQELDGTRRLGGEVEVRSNPVDGLHLSADLTYVDARFTKSKRKIPMAPWLTGSMRAIYSHPTGFRAGAYLLGMAPRTLPHGASSKTYLNLDLSAGYTWQWLNFDIALENVLNRRTRAGEYHFASHWIREQPVDERPVVHFVAGPAFNARFTVSAVF